MKRQPCETCKTPRPFKRALGWGTFFAVLLTGGFWLLLVPFYRLRCMDCGAPYRPGRGEFSWR